MIIIHNRGSKISEVRFETPSGTWDWEHMSNIKIKLGMGGNWQMGLAHEIGHLLHAKYITKPRYMSKSQMIVLRIRLRKRDRMQFRKELVAWRIAKSIIKPELWDEEEAKRWLSTYNYKSLRIDMNRIKIIPYHIHRNTNLEKKT